MDVYWFMVWLAMVVLFTKSVCYLFDSCVRYFQACLQQRDDFTNELKKARQKAKRLSPLDKLKIYLAVRYLKKGILKQVSGGSSGFASDYRWYLDVRMAEEYNERIKGASVSSFRDGIWVKTLH